MQLYLNPLPTSTTTLDRVFAAIMDVLPFPNHTSVPPPRQDKFFSSDTSVQSLDYKHTPEELVDMAIESNISRISKRGTVCGDESFFIADLGQISRQHRRWKQNLPNVRPYYAIKCNSDPTLIKSLADHGTGFDCASIEEMRTILDLGVDPARILFANPCKSAASLVFARKMRVQRTTFDNLDELDTIKMHMPGAKLLLRIYANDDSAIICLGDKFGAPLDTTYALLARAKELGLEVEGVSFHVGTGAKNVDEFSNAIRHAREVFSQATSLGFNPSILDIGGGFEDSSFESTSAHILSTLKTVLPNGVTVIAEPGRFYARSAYTLVSRVISRRRQMGAAAANGVPDMLYQSDGVYGSFMNVIMEKEIMVPTLIKGKSMNGNENGNMKDEKEKTEYRYSIWGPTCDGVDCVAKEAIFDSEVRIGDWLKYSNMGAYTTTTSTKFNGFTSPTDTFYLNSETMSGL